MSDVPQLPGKVGEVVEQVATRRPTETIAFIIMGGMIAGLYLILHYADIRQDEMNKAAQQQSHERLMFILENWQPKKTTLP